MTLRVNARGTMQTTHPNNPATIVHNKYPHTGNVHKATPDGYAGWYEHQLPNHKLAVALWMYEGTDATRRTIIVRLWDEPSPVLTATDIHHGAAASWKTLEFMDTLAAL